MIELDGDQLLFTFPEVHEDATLAVAFMRTLRIPDDGRSYPLPPGLGRFPLRDIDAHARTVTKGWLEQGGAMLPMYQSEALWLRFEPYLLPAHRTSYPFAIKVAAGTINAVTGDAFDRTLHEKPQDYVVAPKQPWLDGWCVEKGLIRQFVAMPLGQGYTAEEQITGKSVHGGIQLAAYPMKRDVFERRFPKSRIIDTFFGGRATPPVPPGSVLSADMGLAAGGRMRQEIFEDPYELADWDQAHGTSIFVRIADSLSWQRITGSPPPTQPPSAKDYARARLPWFEYYDDGKALGGADKLDDLASVGDKESVDVEAHVRKLRAGFGKKQVRDS